MIAIIGTQRRNTRDHPSRAPWLAALVLAVVLTAPASAGWVMERSTRTEGATGPSSEVTLYIARGRVKEVHDDGTYFLWDVPRGLLFQVDPATKSYSGGPVKDMLAAVARYLDDLRARLSRMTDAEREELAKRSGGLPMPVPPPQTPPKWTVRRTGKVADIAKRRGRLHEIHRDGILFAEIWFSEDVPFGSDLDYAAFSRWSRDLEGAFATGMGGAAPSGEEIDRLYRSGLDLRQTLIGNGFRVVTEVTRLEARDVPESTFHLPPDYVLKGTQRSATESPPASRPRRGSLFPARDTASRPAERPRW